MTGEWLTVLPTADLLLLRRNLTKVDFFTDDEGIVHPIRDSEGYEDAGGGDKEPTGPVKIDEGLYRQPDGTLTHWPDLQTMRDEYRKAHPDTMLYLGRLDKLKMVETMSAVMAISKLQDQFPDVHIRELAARDLKNADGTAVSPTVVAQCWPLAEGYSRIELGTAWFGVDAEHSLYSGSNGFHPSGTDSPYGYATHEFGHAVQNALDYYAANADPNGRIADSYGKWWVGGKLESYGGQYTILPADARVDARSFSGYAAKSDREAFAEVFSGAYSGAPASYMSDLAVGMRTMLVAAGMTTPDPRDKVQKGYNPDQPRDENGRFASGYPDPPDYAADRRSGTDEDVRAIAYLWSGGGMFGQSGSTDIRYALSHGLGSTSIGVSQDAAVLARAVADSKPTGYELYRGIHLTEDVYPQVRESLAPGKTVDMNLCSWSKDMDVAYSFARGAWGDADPQDHEVIFKLDPGAKAYNATYDIQQGPSFTEHISGGRYDVSEVFHDTNPDNPKQTIDVITLRQSAVFTQPEQFVGTKVTVADVPWVKASFLPWLEEATDRAQANRPKLDKVYDPDQPRDEQGRWTSAGGGDPAYHAGDLHYGRDTALGRMTPGRNTGHFGTGVYFASSPTAITGRSDRPLQQVDLSRYNLFRPANQGIGMQLHDGLRAVNEAVHGRADIAQAAERLAPVLGTDKYDLMSRIGSAVISTQSDLPAADRPGAPYYETASTRLMRDLGYDGVDVRHIPGMDNTMFGTVVYGEAVTHKLRYAYDRGLDMLIKTEFFTDESGVVHPIRDSEGYDEHYGEGGTKEEPKTEPDKPEPKVQGQRFLSDKVMADVAARITRNVAAFRAAGGTVIRNATRDDIEAAQSNITDFKSMGMYEKDSMKGVQFTDFALDEQIVNIAVIDGSYVAGAHGYDVYETGDFTASTNVFGDETLGHGIFGSTGITSGAGAALVAAYVQDAAQRGMSISIAPIPTAEDYWRGMGMRPIVGDNWGMTAPDVQALAKSLRLT